MPAPLVTVSDPVLPVRELEADEHYVMTAFERHASHCYHCMDPFEVRHEDPSLCDRGHKYAIDVAAYLYSKNGKAYSVVDRELNQPTLVKIPRECFATRGLLLAIEDGLRLKRKDRVQTARSVSPVARVTVDKPATPVISYDRTYFVPARRPQPTITYSEIIEREPQVKNRRVIVYPSPRGSPSRGSLYDIDAADRVERVKESSRIYRPTEYYR